MLNFTDCEIIALNRAVRAENDAQAADTALQAWQRHARRLEARNRRLEEEKSQLARQVRLLQGVLKQTA